MTHAEKWGPLLAILAALCLLEFGPAVTLLSFASLRVLLSDVILVPLLAAGTGATLWALASDRYYHRERGPSRAGWAAALLLGSFWLSPLAAWIGVGLLAGAATWNLVLVSRLPERRSRARETGRKL